MKPWQWVLVPASALAGAGVVVLLLGGDGEFETNETPNEKAEKPAVAVSGTVVRPAMDIGVKKRKERMPAKATDRVRKALVAAEDEFSHQDREIVDAIQKAMQADDLQGLSKLLENVRANTNAVVRMEAVDALRWFGDKALSELTPLLADPDDDVRIAAIEAWTSGVSQMEAGKDKADTVLMGLRVVTDKEQLESLVMQVDDLEDVQKIEILAETIEGANEHSAEVAREHYKFLTNEDYTDRAAAQRWLDAQADGDENISPATP